MLVGAYERENFGDLLFQRQTALFSKADEILTSAPTGADMTLLLGTRVQPYAPVLAAEKVDAIWVVGGEVGATSMTDALTMSLSPEDSEAFTKLTRQRQRELVLELTGRPWYASPYLPRALKSDASRPRTIVNSVGIVGLKSLRGRRRLEVERVLRTAAYLCVREARSAKLLRLSGIRHRVAPDLVHSLTTTDPVSAPANPDVALVQFKATSLGLEPAAIARALVDAPALRRFRIRFFMAGSAPGHDSSELYESVAEHIRRLDPGRDVTVSDAYDPMDKVREIADAGLWIGTSLHGLIVSTAYAVPHVSLTLKKLSSYASTWSDPMPSGVQLTDLDAAVDAALEAARRTDLRARAEDLAGLAVDSARRAADIASS